MSKLSFLLRMFFSWDDTDNCSGTLKHFLLIVKRQKSILERDGVEQGAEAPSQSRIERDRIIHIASCDPNNKYGRKVS